MAAIVTAAVLAVPSGTAGAAGPAGAGDWSAAWATGLHHPVPGNDWDGPNWSVDGFTGESVRQVVRVSTGGSQLRVRLSNRYGTQPLRLTGATVGSSGPGAAVRPGTLRPLTFRHRPSVTVPVGAELVSDPVRFGVAALDRLTVTFYFADPTGPATFHQGGLTTTYRATGDRRSEPGADAFGGDTSHSWYYLAGVDVSGPPPRGAGRGGSDGRDAARDTVVAFGDSLTDGYGSTPGADNRYPDQLAERLVAGGHRLGVVNVGINGNKLLADSPCYGERGVTRFHRDALGQPGVRAVVVLIGTNDIGGGGFPDFGCGASPVVTAAEVVDGHRALVRAAHRQGIQVVGLTIPPWKGAFGYDTPANEAVRDRVNDSLRAGVGYDALVDLDRLLADPADSDALRPEFDAGDRLHLNDAGAELIATEVARALR
ncbi:SGNH/GDSL hydrolase family protein [Plantactinospora mayteni]|uniref:SGNH hydrolase n=1 Tax=Plantactinospora mayteni TaxID=566021 RepID=A0ABQ4EIW9_9ACTN|nr:SGNH/GDSL hydrolase family protein [Plantactinospora mayteni]GIG94676.1 SGNH hydrolase [Plantactinospora mayteni]